MAKHLCALFLLVLSAALPAQEGVPAVRVDYVVDATDAAAGSATVEMTVRNHPGEEFRVAIPAWAPGSYRIVNYHARVREVSAHARETKLEVSPVDPRTWSVKSGGRPEVTVRYRLTPDRNQIGSDHYYIEGPATYLYVTDRKEAACTVRFKIPDGGWCATCKKQVPLPHDEPEHQAVRWQVGTGLSDLGDGIFGARDYDTFVDCPTEVGPFERHVFREGRATYELVVHAAGKWDSERLLDALRKIVREQCALFGGPPFERYVFLYHFENKPGGYGLEHLNSTNISMPYFAMRENGLIAASITSHEFFHLWNVKRLRPRELGPFDYTQPGRSKALWFCEGVTSYYGDLTLARTGIWSEAQYFSHLANEVEALENNPLRKSVSVEQSSWTVWDRKREDPYLDYYNKGELIGWLLDLEIRRQTGGRRSLDDVMRHLYHTYVVKPSKAGQGPIGVGFPEDGILKAVNEVSGRDYSDFFRRYVAGTDELPLVDVGREAGLKIEITVTRTPTLESPLQGVSVLRVRPGGEDEKAGLRAGDRIVQIGGTRVLRRTIREELRKRGIGSKIPVRVEREGGPIELELTVVSNDSAQVRLSRRRDANTLQKRILKGWLSSVEPY